ncbi:MAG TPA: hypothetical protein VNA25_25300 [Phycisphaerae bacterium]|nr:hypothetical protein [Phycisphaerae bacterium]
MSKRALLTATVILVGCATAIMLAGPDGPNRPVRPMADAAGEPGGQRPLGPPRQVVHLTPSQEKELLGVLKEKRPEDHDWLMRLKDRNPRAYRWALSTAWRTYQNWKNFPSEIQEAIRVQQTAKLKSWRLCRQYRGGKDESVKQALHSELLEVLGQEFDADQKIREFQLKQLEERIKLVREELKTRAEHRDEVVKENLERLLARKEPDAMRMGRRFRVPTTRPSK